MTTDFFELQKEKKTTIVWLNKPQTNNAMTLDFWFGLKPLLEELQQDDTVSNILIAAKGENFSQGLDIRSLLQEFDKENFLPANTSEKRRKLYHFIKKMQEGISQVALVEKPVVALVQGQCIGGGLDLIAACDFRYATSNAVFSLREAKVGIVADMGSLQRLPYIIGEGQTRQLAMRAHDIDAEEALRIGLIEKILTGADPVDEALKIMHAMAKLNQQVLTGVKRSMNLRTQQQITMALDDIALYNASFLENETFARLISLLKKKG